MSTLGVSPTTFSLDKGYGSTGTVDFNSATAVNKVTVLSFIDITRGWEWMHTLRKLQDDIAAAAFASDVQILAVVFNYYYTDAAVSETYGFDTYSGNISRNWIEAKIDSDASLAGINFTVVVDATWTAPSPAAENIIDDYSGATDSPRPAPGTFWYAGIVDKNFKVSDKWEYNTTPSADAVSFNHITGLIDPDTGLVIPPFQSNNAVNDYRDVRAYIIKRIQNLIDPIFIIGTDPAGGDTVRTLNQSKIFFSKPVNTAEAQNVNNYTLNGGGFTGTEHPSSVTHPGSNPENVSTLTIPDVLDDSAPAVTITVTGLHDTTPATAIPPGPLALVTAGGANVINLVADVTPPSIVSSTIAAANASITVTFDDGLFADNNGTGALTADDFNVSITPNGGNATAVTKGAVSHTAGAASVTILLTFNNLPSGAETIEVTPASDSIFDIVGNASLMTTTTGPKILFNQAVPAGKGFIRDSPDDDGTPLSVTGRCTSPDIIICPTSTPAGTFTDLNLSYGTGNVEIGNNNYLYIRVLNNSPAETGPLLAKIYYAPLLVTLSPSSWRLIQSDVPVPSVPAAAGGIPGYSISGEIRWNPDPAEVTEGFDSYCLIAMFKNDSAGSVYPDEGAAISSWNEYLDFIHANNNVAYRNIATQDILDNSVWRWHFNVQGLAGNITCDLVFDGSELPDNTKAVLKISNKIIKKNTQWLNVNIADKIQTPPEISYTFAKGKKILRLKNINFDGVDLHRNYIEITLPAGTAPGKVCKLRIYQERAGFIAGSVTLILRCVTQGDVEFIGLRPTNQVHRKNCIKISVSALTDRVPFETLRDARIRGFDPAPDCLAGVLKPVDVSARLKLVILDFFNKAETSKVLQDKVKDTPGIGYHNGKYGQTDVSGLGLTAEQAQAILIERDRLGGFKTIEQVDAVKGIGKDTFTDIVNSFKPLPPVRNEKKTAEKKPLVKVKAKPAVKARPKIKPAAEKTVKKTAAIKTKPVIKKHAVQKAKDTVRQMVKPVVKPKAKAAAKIKNSIKKKISTKAPAAVRKTVKSAVGLKTGSVVGKTKPSVKIKAALKKKAVANVKAAVKKISKPVLKPKVKPAVKKMNSGKTKPVVKKTVKKAGRK